MWFWGLGRDRLGSRLGGLGDWARWVVLGHGGQVWWLGGGGGVWGLGGLARTSFGFGWEGFWVWAYSRHRGERRGMRETEGESDYPPGVTIKPETRADKKQQEKTTTATPNMTTRKKPKNTNITKWATER